MTKRQSALLQRIAESETYARVSRSQSDDVTALENAGLVEQAWWSHWHYRATEAGRARL